MALVVDPHNSGMASGSVGSLTASRNRAGAIMRRRVKPVQPRSPAVTKQRYAFTKQNRNFLNLTVAQQTLWDQFGDANPVTNKLGQSIYNTGINWYIALSSRLYRANVSIASSPPINAEPTFLPYVSIAQNSAGEGIKIGFNESFSLANRVWVYGTGALSQSRNFKSKSMRLLTLFNNQVTSANPTLIASPVQDGTAYQFETRSVDAHGRATAPQRFTVYPVSS